MIKSKQLTSDGEKELNKSDELQLAGRPLQAATLRQLKKQLKPILQTACLADYCLLVDRQGLQYRAHVTRQVLYVLIPGHAEINLPNGQASGEVRPLSQKTIFSIQHSLFEFIKKRINPINLDT